MAVAGASRTDVLVYSGEGAGARSVQSAVQHLQATLRLSAPGRPPLKVRHPAPTAESPGGMACKALQGVKTANRTRQRVVARCLYAGMPDPARQRVFWYALATVRPPLAAQVATLRVETSWPTRP